MQVPRGGGGGFHGGGAFHGGGSFHNNAAGALSTVVPRAHSTTAAAHSETITVRSTLALRAVIMTSATDVDSHWVLASGHSELALIDTQRRGENRNMFPAAEKSLPARLNKLPVRMLRELER
jgi:hypothetical protein